MVSEVGSVKLNSAFISFSLASSSEIGSSVEDIPPRACLIPSYPYWTLSKAGASLLPAARKKLVLLWQLSRQLE